MPDDVEAALPRAVALSWGVAERPQRGPKRELSIERIVDTAIAIADSDGLAAVSMSRIAGDLGFTTMSLYRYVTSKDDVLALMQDAVCDVPIPPDDEDDAAPDWRQGLREWAMASIHVIEAHPWFPDIPITGVPLMPNNLAVLDWGLRVMRALPLSHAEKMSVALLLSSYARAVGIVERDMRLSRRDDAPPQNGEAFVAALGELVTPERFPDLAPLVGSGAYVDDGSDGQDDFAFGLERILDGIERYVAAREQGEELSPAPERPEAVPNDKTVREASKARREAEKALREARKRERETIERARERIQRETEKAAREAERRGR
ncbi:TetR/AcrR family transcriptional regulator C-terminal domain-containing protein [Leifsonia sp. NPDC058194]|uniref:TetR/AcrR family transcriptional regulator n=1 Tax=Leifsonia sp. NPDC058194 TaxID=3346374 RepID=UPI0036DBE6FC